MDGKVVVLGWVVRWRCWAGGWSGGDGVGGVVVVLGWTVVLGWVM